ncbi:hypothetical protein Tco_0664730 [Tanacetum coccineum]
MIKTPKLVDSDLAVQMVLEGNSAMEILVVAYGNLNIVMENPNHPNEPNEDIPEENPVIPEPNHVEDAHDPNEMVDIPDDEELVDYDEEDPMNNQPSPRISKVTYRRACLMLALEEFPSSL